MTWIKCSNRLPPGRGDIVFVKRENGDEIKAYYHSDRMAWLSPYTKDRLSHFQSHETREFLHDVKEWKPLYD